MDILILLVLILFNGLLALSELAIVSARKARLRNHAQNGSSSARVALQLAQNSNRFLSTVQIGITVIGIGAGVFGGSRLAIQAEYFIQDTIPIFAPYAEQLSLILIVGLTTYLSLVIGELVPKQIALAHPEKVAMLIAHPMNLFAQITAPLVIILSKSSAVILRLLRIDHTNQPFITDFDVFALMREGLQSGEFMRSEQEMVKGVLELDDTRVREIITPRPDLVWFDLNDTLETVREKLATNTYSAYPICDGSIDNVIGVVRSKDLLQQFVTQSQFAPQAIMHKPIFFPETVQALEVLNQFKRNPVHMALIVGEFGGIEGAVTLNDLIEEVVGDVDMADPEAIQREDGSWLIDGQYPIDKLHTIISEFSLPENEAGAYHTIAGFVLTRFGHVPETTATVTWQGCVYEVVDMDGTRIDKILVTQRNSSFEENT